jgi:hypothetical protein
VPQLRVDQTLDAADRPARRRLEQLGSASPIPCGLSLVEQKVELVDLVAQLGELHAGQDT